MSKNKKLRSAFGGFGNKQMVADVIWTAIGSDVKIFKDICCNTASILLGRPLPNAFETAAYVEQINDVDGIVINALRAIASADPKKLALLCEQPPAEVDLIAAHREVIRRRGGLCYRLKQDINYFDIKLAAIFIRATRAWVGGGFGDESVFVGKKAPRAKISKYQGGSALKHFELLQKRFKNVQILCGDGLRLVGSKTQLSEKETAAVIFDPPYPHITRGLIYNHDLPTVARDMRIAALNLGERPNIRVVYCGLYSLYDQFFPENWQRYQWKSPGGYSSQGNNQVSKKNARDECVWFSPACFKIPERES